MYILHITLHTDTIYNNAKYLQDKNPKRGTSHPHQSNYILLYRTDLQSRSSLTNHTLSYRVHLCDATNANWSTSLNLQQLSGYFKTERIRRYYCQQNPRL